MTRLYQARAWNNMMKQVKRLAAEDESYVKVQTLMQEIGTIEYNNKDTAKEVSEILTDYMNNNYKGDELAEQIANFTHPTLQQNVFRMFRKAVDIWSVKDIYDMRNEETVRQSKIIAEALKEDGVPFN